MVNVSSIANKKKTSNEEAENNKLPIREISGHA